MNIILYLDKTTDMDKLYLLQNPEVFQGEKYLNSNKNYFEGWYFKHTNEKQGVSFIPGINIENGKKKAFIQVITNTASYFVNYPMKDFKFNQKSFKIQIGKNLFSKDGIQIDIEDTSQNLKISGNLKYSNCQNIKINLLSPNIMGPFSYVPKMECNHAILSMKHDTRGWIKINDQKINLDNHIGYIEKDWGYSFPKSYLWCQGNDFQDSKVSFMISIADIPFKFFNFRGFICVLLLGNKEYKFTTYNSAKIIKYDVNNNSLDVSLKKGAYTLNVKSAYHEGNKLSAPVKGKMTKDIFESISEIISVTLKKGNSIVFSDISKNCGLEVVQK